MILFQFLNIPCIHSHPKYIKIHVLSPKKRKLGGLKLLRSMLLPHAAEKKINDQLRPEDLSQWPLHIRGLDLLETDAFLYMVVSTVSLSCTIISLYPAMHKEGNSNRHFIFHMLNLSKYTIELQNLLDDSAKFETLAGTAPQSVGCGARYSDISMFSLGRRKLIIFWLCESQRLAMNDHKQAGTNHTSHLNSINFNHLSANPSGIHLVDIYVYIYFYSPSKKSNLK